MGYDGGVLGSSAQGTFYVPAVTPRDVHNKFGIEAPKQSKSKNTKGKTMAEGPIQFVYAQTSIPQPHTDSQKKANSRGD